MLIWKIVFWVTTILILFAVIMTPFAGIPSEAEGIISLPIQALGQLCIYGYAYQKAVGTKKIAIAIFVLNLALSIYSLIEAAPLLLELKELWEISLFAAAAIIVVVLLIPLYRYSFKSEHIWGHAA